MTAVTRSYCARSPCRRCRTGTSVYGAIRTTALRLHRAGLLGRACPTARCGGFDALFIADAVGQLDVFGGDADAALARGVQTPVTDPLLASRRWPRDRAARLRRHRVDHVREPVPAGPEVQHAGPPDRGRIGWNIVTSLLDSAARNIIGRDRQIPHDERYAIAQEFVEVTYKLWEGSWEDDAVVRDRKRRVYTDPAKVHADRATRDGTSAYRARTWSSRPQRTPVLFQAGTSTAGREFAARNAELVFASDPRPDVLRTTSTISGDARSATDAARVDQVHHLDRDRHRQYRFGCPGQGRGPAEVPRP